LVIEGQYIRIILSPNLVVSKCISFINKCRDA